jgi:hypothetical protein
LRGRGRFVARELSAETRLRAEARPLALFAPARRFAAERTGVFFAVFLAGFLAARFAGFLGVRLGDVAVRFEVFFVVRFVVFFVERFVVLFVVRLATRFAGLGVRFDVFFVVRFVAGVLLAPAVRARVFLGAVRRRGSGDGTYPGQPSVS